MINRMLSWGIIFTIMGIWTGIGMPLFLFFGQMLIESNLPPDFPEVGPNFMNIIVIPTAIIVGIVFLVGGIIMIVIGKKKLN